jgi:hypothetical protein
VEAAGIAVGGSGLTWQSTKHSQCFKTVSVGKWGMGIRPSRERSVGSVYGKRIYTIRV